jgi:hypothetical protein
VAHGKTGSMISQQSDNEKMSVHQESTQQRGVGSDDATSNGISSSSSIIRSHSKHRESTQQRGVVSTKQPPQEGEGLQLNMNGGDPEIKQRQAIGELSTRRSKRLRQDTNVAEEQEEMEETQEVGHEPSQEAETVYGVGAQEEEEVMPTPPHRTDSVNDVGVKNIEDVHQPTHEEEQEKESDTDINLSALFQDSDIKDPSSSDDSRVEREFTVRVLIPAEAEGTFLGEYSATINAIRDSTRCIEVDMETNTGAEHSRITIRMPDMDVAHQAENIITNVVRAHKEGDLEYITGVIAKGIMTKAMEGDAAADILTYLPTGEVVNAILTVRAWYSKARDM